MIHIWIHIWCIYAPHSALLPSDWGPGLVPPSSLQCMSADVVCVPFPLPVCRTSSCTNEGCAQGLSQGGVIGAFFLLRNSDLPGSKTVTFAGETPSSKKPHATQHADHENDTPTSVDQPRHRFPTVARDLGILFHKPLEISALEQCYDLPPNFLPAPFSPCCFLPPSWNSQHQPWLCSYRVICTDV